MARRSLRTSLTVGNVATLVCLLVLFAGALVLMNQARVRAALERDLVMQAGRAARLGPPPGPPPPGAMPPTGRPPEEWTRGDRRPPPPGPHGPPGPLMPEVYEEAGLIAAVRRPRFFDRRGGQQGPFGSDAPFDAKALATGLAGQALFSTVTLSGEPIRVYTAPLRRRGEVVGAVQVARELRELSLLWRTQMGALLVLLPLAVAAAALGALALTNRALKPISAVTQAAAEISHSDLSRRLEVHGEDELGELSRTFNEMLGRLERSFGEIRTAYEGMEAAYENQRRLTADASHELRTPLTRLRLATSASLSGTKTPEELRDALATADRAADSMARLVDQLLTLARADAGQLGLVREPLDLRVVVAEALEESGEDERVAARFPDRSVPLLADGGHLKRVVINLVENARRHTPPEGRVEVAVNTLDGEAVVTVSDTGEGIPKEHLGRVFDRFYRVDSARARQGGGSGLGLAICKELIENQGGRIELSSEAGAGTVVQVFLPLAADPGRSS